MTKMYELTGAELDAVAAGQGNGLGIGGLVGAGVHTLKIRTRSANVPREHARQRRPLDCGLLPRLRPPRGRERGPISGTPAGQII